MSLNAWEVFWESFWTNGAYHRVFGEGLLNTLIIAVSGLLIGIVIGTLISIVKVMPKYKVLPRVLDAICTVYVNFFRGTPIVVQLLIAYYVLFPLLQWRVSSLSTCVIIFGMNSGAYISELMRSGIQSVDPGQMEGGRAVGMSFGATMVQIVVPQAIKNILPALGNEFIALIKDTSVVSFVACVDLYKVFTDIGNVHYEYLIPYLVMALMYLVMVLIISAGIKLLEKSLARSDRQKNGVHRKHKAA